MLREKLKEVLCGIALHPGDTVVMEYYTQDYSHFLWRCPNCGRFASSTNQPTPGMAAIETAKLKETPHGWG